MLSKQVSGTESSWNYIFQNLEITLWLVSNMKSLRQFWLCKNVHNHDTRQQDHRYVPIVRSERWKNRITTQLESRSKGINQSPYFWSCWFEDPKIVRLFKDPKTMHQSVSIVKVFLKSYATYKCYISLLSWWIFFVSMCYFSLYGNIYLMSYLLFSYDHYCMFKHIMLG